MTNAELLAKIKAEIRRRIKENESWKDFHRSKGGTTNFDDVKIVELQSILSFISTLESEKPTQEGLEEEINRTYHDGSVTDTSDLDHNSYENIARHFAQWQKEQMMKEAIKGEVIIYDGLWQIHTPDLDTVLRKMDEGDKVRIIIVKEDEK